MEAIKELLLFLKSVMKVWWLCLKSVLDMKIRTECNMVTCLLNGSLPSTLQGMLMNNRSQSDTSLESLYDMKPRKTREYYTERSFLSLGEMRVGMGTRGPHQCLLRGHSLSVGSWGTHGVSAARRRAQCPGSTEWVVKAAKRKTLQVKTGQGSCSRLMWLEDIQPKLTEFRFGILHTYPTVLTQEQTHFTVR